MLSFGMSVHCSVCFNESMSVSLSMLQMQYLSNLGQKKDVYVYKRLTFAIVQDYSSRFGGDSFVDIQGKRQVQLQMGGSSEEVSN